MCLYSSLGTFNVSASEEGWVLMILPSTHQNKLESFLWMWIQYFGNGAQTVKSEVGSRAFVNSKNTQYPVYRSEKCMAFRKTESFNQSDCYWQQWKIGISKNRNSVLVKQKSLCRWLPKCQSHRQYLHVFGGKKNWISIFSRALLLARSDSTSHSAMLSVQLSVYGRTPPPVLNWPPPTPYQLNTAEFKRLHQGSLAGYLELHFFSSSGSQKPIWQPPFCIVIAE